MYKYAGDPGQYPIFSMFDITNKFPLSNRIILSTNATSKIGNNGVFVLTNDALGFISKSIFGLNEFHKVWLNPNIETDVNGRQLLIKGFEVMESRFLNSRRNYFKEEWGNRYESYDHFFFHYTDISINMSSKEKAIFIASRIHFQIGIHEGEKQVLGNN